MMGAQEVAQVAQKGGSAVAMGGGAWAWLAENASAIGAACAIGGFAIAVLGFAVNLWFNYQRHKKGA